MNIQQIIDNFSENTNPLIEGKSKIIYPTIDEQVCLMRFKPHLRSITSKREENISGTEYYRILATVEIMNRLQADGIPTQLVYPKIIRIEKSKNANKKNSNEESSQNYIAVARVTPIPIEWICRYQAAGSIVRLFPTLVKEGQKFSEPLFKYDFKQDIKIAGVDDPTLNESYIVGLGLLSRTELETAKELLRKVSENVHRYLQEANIDLIDLKIELGFDPYRKMLVIDEISQDCIRACDKTTKKSLTKDVFRNLRTEEEVVEAYKLFAKRLNPNIEKYLTG